VIAYRVMPDVPRELVAYLAALLRAERRARGTRRKARALTCFRQALFALVWFRKREHLTVLGAGFGISRATANGHRDEAVAVLSAEAPDLTEAVDRVQGDGWSHVILDGRSSTPTGAGPRPPVETHRHKPQNQHHQRSAFSARSTPPATPEPTPRPSADASQTYSRSHGPRPLSPQPGTLHRESNQTPDPKMSNTRRRRKATGPARKFRIKMKADAP
jgi:hypothetical protein